MPISSSKSKTTDSSQDVSEYGVASRKGHVVQDEATLVTLGTKANTGTQFSGITGNITINDGAAVSDLAGTFSETLNSALSGTRSIAADALTKISDRASGGEDSTKKTLLWLGLAGLALYFFSRK